MNINKILKSYTLCLIFLLFYGFLNESILIADSLKDAVNHLSIKAQNLEKQGQVPKALFFWKTIYEIDPSNQEAVTKISQLKDISKKKAEKLFKKGLKYLSKKNKHAAQKAFLKVLAYNPDHEKALNYLHTRLSNLKPISYKIKKGDTPKKIANKIYKDSKKSFIISYFANSSPSSSLKSDTILYLPRIKMKILKRKKKNPKPEVKDSIIVLEDPKMEVEDPEIETEYSKKEIKRIETENQNYTQGLQMLAKKKYQAALKLFNNLSPDFKDVKKQITKLKSLIKAQAEIYYKNGVKFYLEEKLEAAISQWENALKLVPNHKKALKYIQTTRSLIKKLNKIK